MPTAKNQDLQTRVFRATLRDPVASLIEQPLGQRVGLLSGAGARVEADPHKARVVAIDKCHRAGRRQVYASVEDFDLAAQPVGEAETENAVAAEP